MNVSAKGARGAPLDPLRERLEQTIGDGHGALVVLLEFDDQVLDGGGTTDATTLAFTAGQLLELSGRHGWTHGWTGHRLWLVGAVTSDRVTAAAVSAISEVYLAAEGAAPSNVRLQATFARPSERAGDVLARLDGSTPPTSPAAASDGVPLQCLDDALEAGRLTCFYQPVLDLVTGHVTAAEALVRLPGRDGSWIRPDHFIPLAERTGRIKLLGRQVLEMATRDAVVWRQRHGHVAVNVNVSPCQLDDDTVFDDVVHALDRSGLPPEDLTIEVTEGVLVTDAEAAIEALVGLRAIGVGLAIDDFGAGYSSLSYLQRLPAETIKLDRSLLAGRCGDVIVRGAIDLAHALGLEVVVEGVETTEQLAMIREAGADRAQGYLISRPVPADAIEGALEQCHVVDLVRLERAGDRGSTAAGGVGQRS